MPQGKGTTTARQAGKGRAGHGTYPELRSRMTFTCTFSARTVWKMFLMKFSSIQPSISPILYPESIGMLHDEKSSQCNVPEGLRGLVGGRHGSGRSEASVA